MIFDITWSSRSFIVNPPPSWYAGSRTDLQVKSTAQRYAELFTDAGTEIAA